MKTDKLERMWELRTRYMTALSDKRPGIRPPEVMDLTDKSSQRELRDISLRGVEEVFEALAHLKNWKPHRSSDVPDFDKEKFKEEFVDAFNFFLSVLVLSGITADEFFDAYERKDKIIHERLDNGY